MGFTCGLYVYPRYKDLTAKDIWHVREYFSYFKNNWAKENFDTVEKYMDEYHYRMPSQEEIEFFKPLVHKDKWGYVTISDSIEDWCSNGRFLYDIVQSELKCTDDGDCGLVYKFDNIKPVVTILNALWKQYNERFQFSDASINYAFTEVLNDEEEDAEIHLKKCDGIEVRFEDGTSERFYTNHQFQESYGACFTFPRSEFDVYDMSAMKMAVDAFIWILQNVDFEKQFVQFSGGW